MAWVIDVPGWVPGRCNAWSGRHWSARSRLTREAADLLAAYAAQAGVPRVGPANPRVRRVRVTLHGWPRGRVPDPDAFLKVLFDGLKGAGLVVDDSQDWLQWDRPVLVRAPGRRTVVEIEDVS